MNLGVFGGQFDPPHDGHLAVVRAARGQLSLDRVLVIPDGNPPHRAPSVLPARTRLRLAEAAFAGEPRVEVRAASTGDRPEYTVHMLERLAIEGELHLIIGADQYASFGSWRDPERIRELASLVVAPRTGYPVSDPDVEVLDMPPVDLSSTELRERLGAGEDGAGRIPPAAWQIILDEGLYGRSAGAAR